MIKKNNNIITFPSALGARFYANPSRFDSSREISTEYIENGENIESIGNLIFYGDKIVLEFTGIEPSVSDMWLYFQIIENFQKGDISYEDKNDYEKSHVDNEISLKTKKKLVDEYSILYKNDIQKIFDTDERTNFIFEKVEKEIERRKQKIEDYLYLSSNKNVVVDINISSLLKERDLDLDINNKLVIASGLKRLAKIGLNWYIMNDSLVEEVKALKKKFNNNSSLYMNDLTVLFKKRISKTNLYIRQLIQGANVEDNYSIARVFLDKGFFDLTLRSQKFDFSILKQLKGNVAKTLFVNLNFAFKNSMTKDYLYSVLNLNESTRDDKKLATSKTAIQELIRNEILTPESGYDKTSQTFKFYLSESFFIKSGYKAKQEYSLKKQSKMIKEKSKVQECK